MEGIAASGQALTVRYIQKPQDGSADTVIRAGLSPSYVTYNASTVQQVSAFFKTGQVRPACAPQSWGQCRWWPCGAHAATSEGFSIQAELVHSILCRRVHVLQWRCLHPILQPLYRL